MEVGGGWGGAIMTPVNEGGVAALGDSAAAPSCPAANRSILVFPDADILCPSHESEDGARLAAALVVGVGAAAKRGMGVVFTAMDQMQASNRSIIIVIIIISSSSSITHSSHPSAGR